METINPNPGLDAAFPSSASAFSPDTFNQSDPYWLDPVTVIGRRTSGTGWSGGNGSGSGGNDWDGHDTGWAPPNEDYVPPPVRPQGWSECLDREIDDLAELAANVINEISDSNRTEYGYIIWKDSNGDVHLSSRFVGDNNSLTGLNPSSKPSDFGFTSWSQVVGIIHSHPNERLNSENDWVTIPASDNHGMTNSGDWWWPAFWISQGADAGNFRQYILHRGAMIEFDMYDNPSSLFNRNFLATNQNGECP